MRNKISKMKGLAALILALCLTIGTLAGCTGNTGNEDTTAATTKADEGTKKDDGTTAADTKEENTEAASGETMNVGGLSLPLSEEKAELTVWLVYNGTVVADLNDIEGVKKMEELTNVHINWIPVSLFELGDKYGILLSSDSLPDIIYPADYTYPGGNLQGVEDGVIYEDMDTLIRENMPNYMAFLNSNDEARREATEDNGKFATVKNIVGVDGVAQSEGTYVGAAYRADILKKMGVDVPTTIDGWHDVLLKAKQDGICEHPFMLNTNGSSPLSQSWGVASQSIDYYQLENDKVEYAPALDGYGEYLKVMRQWYSDGLIDPNFTSFQFYLETPASVEANQCILYSMFLSAFTGKSYYNMHMVNNEEADLQPLNPPALVEGETCEYGWGSRIIARAPHYITTSCKNPVLAAKWLDFLYSEVGERLIWYGIEGVTYEIGEDGTPHYTDLVLRNPDGIPAKEVLQKYALGAGECQIGHHNVAASWKLNSDLSGEESQEVKAVEIWSSPKINLYFTSSISLSDEEGQDANRINTALKTMVQEYSINYIIGTDNTDFETFRQSLYDNGLQKVVDIYQAAYDRYLAR